MTDAGERTISELAAALDEGRITSSDLVEAAIANHERWDGVLHAYSQWAPEAARKAARAADAAFAAGVRVGALQGIPISVKDLFGVAGFPTFAGTARRLPPKWEREGPLVARLKEQLGVVVGKTHMVEFALGGTGVNAHWDAPRNPWDREAPRSPGGSSSGAGVSLAEGSALLALGTDTAGSVRIPAAATGHVGLKVTCGRWSAEGLVPLSPTFDTPGLLVRSVADAVTCFGAVDPAWGDAGAFERRISSCELADVRIGMGDETLWGDCEAGIAEAVKDALDELARAGARLKESALPQAAEANAIFREGGLSAIELRAFLDDELPDWLGALDPINAAVVAKAASVPATVYINRRQRLARLAEAADAAFESADVLACPTLAITPPALAAIRDGESHWQANRALTRNTCPMNYLGLCAITLPVGRDRAGIPVGLQLIARGGQEERLLAVAAAAERVLGTAPRRLGRPPLLAR
jgi:aspartyl-tRNA(Asn)/glutamyl-tRNA(Gln) amidotransferase subunit A